MVFQLQLLLCSPACLLPEDWIAVAELPQLSQGIAENAEAERGICHLIGNGVLQQVFTEDWNKPMFHLPLAPPKNVKQTHLAQAEKCFLSDLQYK